MKKMFAMMLCVFLAACGGGGGTSTTSTSTNTTTPSPTATNLTLSGTVSGTTFVAVDASSNTEVGRNVATLQADGTKRFNLTIPSEKTYKFFLITNENTPLQEIHTIYQSTSNTFSVTGNVSFDFGTITYSSTAAVPTNNLLTMAGVSGSATTDVIPASVQGTYNSKIFYSNVGGSGFSAYSILQKTATAYLASSQIYDLTVNGSKVAYIDVNGDINQFDVSSQANAKLSSGASYVDPSYLKSTSALVSDSLGKIYTSNLSTWSPSQITAIASGFKPVAVGGSNGAEMLYSTAVNYQYTTLYKFTFQSSASTQLLAATALGASSFTDYASSPDGAYIAISAYVNYVPTIFVSDKNGQNVSQITTGKRVCWSPDGKYLAYIDNIDMMAGTGKLYIVEIATKTKKQLLDASGAAITATDSAISWQ
jgi:hypothetical protein